MSSAFYIPDTGEFFRNGKRCDYQHGSGYRMVWYQGKRTLAHIAAHHAMTGDWPHAGFEIDHRDTNPQNNIWSNLRPANTFQNRFNRRVQRNNSTGEKNVYLDCSGRSRLPYWKISIKAFGQRFKWSASHRLSAILAARLIRRVLHGEFAKEAA